MGLCLLSCDSKKSESQAKGQDLETQQMVAELAALQSSGNVLEMWHQNKIRAEYFEQQAGSISDPGQRFSMLYQAGSEWLNDGNYTKSIEVFSDIIDKHESGEFVVEQSSIIPFYELLAVSYLRKGEIENCIHHHDVHSCIMPIQTSAHHKQRKGSEAAIQIYEKILNFNPNDLQSIWLYNLAHMTLGSYPAEVKKPFLIPETVFNSDTVLHAFVDVATQSGVAVNEISGSVIVDDFNNDGLLDLVVSSYGLDDQIRYFQNDGNGKFSDRTHDAGLTGIVSGLNILQADYNNDGYLDFIILRGAWLGKAGKHPNSLIRNNGDGSFSDVTRSSGIYSLHPTQTASWADFNNDGWLDLFIGNETSPSSVNRSELYVNQGDGSFKEKSAEFGLDVELFVKGCNWGDIDNDGDQDLLISNLVGPNRLYENLGKESGFIFKDISNASGVLNPRFSFPCWFWDVNADGLLDIYINSFDIRDFTTASGKVAADYMNRGTESELSKLYINKGNNTFSDLTSDYGLDKILYTMGCNFADIDNDGYQDFYASTGTPDFRAVFPNRMFRNNKGGSFQDVTTTTGTGHIQKGHGVGFGDMDNDGDQDMYVVLGGSYNGDNFMNALFENKLSNGNNWLSLELEGTDSNRSAIGSRIEIKLEDVHGHSRTIYRTVNSGASFGCNSLRQEIGIGNYENITNVTVYWQAGLKEEFFGLKPNTFYKLKEGTAEVQQLSRSPFSF